MKEKHEPAALEPGTKTLADDNESSAEASPARQKETSEPVPGDLPSRMRRTSLLHVRTVRSAANGYFCNLK
jgi:hypothetical protein